MRSDMVPGGTFPDFELLDHTKHRAKLSELQGDDPLILTLARVTTAQRAPATSRAGLLLSQDLRGVYQDCHYLHR